MGMEVVGGRRRTEAIFSATCSTSLPYCSSSSSAPSSTSKNSRSPETVRASVMRQSRHMRARQRSMSSSSPAVSVSGGESRMVRSAAACSSLLRWRPCAEASRSA